MFWNWYALWRAKRNAVFFLSSTANVSIPVFQSFFTSCHSWWLSEFQKILTKVTSPLGSNARACRFESCHPHHIECS